jgi:hypothetical protein
MKDESSAQSVLPETIVPESTQFGTEGSEAQILSPRPKFPENT